MSDTLSPLREGRITASNVGAILGLDPYRTADDVMRAMVRAHHGAEKEFNGNVATEWGNGFEDEARQTYVMDTGNEVRRIGFCIHPDHDWLGATPDSFVEPDGLLEIKCPYGKRKGGDLKPLSEQPHYAAQIQVQLACTGKAWCDFYQWAPHTTKLERVYVDPAFNLWPLRAFYLQYIVERAIPAEDSEHLQDKRATLDNIAAHKLVAEYFELKDAENKAATRSKELLAEIVKLAQGRPSQIGNHKLTLIEKDGAVSYAQVVKKYLPKLDLSEFRGKPSSYWMLK